MKTKTISFQFLVTYIFMFSMIVFVGVVGIVSHGLYTNAVAESFGVDVDKLLEDYNNTDLYQAAENQNLTPYDYIEILDQNYTITDHYNSMHEVGYTYSENEFDNLVFSNDYYNYYVFETEDGGYIVLYMEPYAENGTALIITVITFVVFMALILVIFARVTSRNIVKPVNMLVEGVKKIADGDYGNHIDYKTSNELDDLIDSINILSTQLKDQVELREKSDEARKNLILGLSHDVKTPLTNIIGYSEMMLSDSSLSDDEVKRNLKIIHSNGLVADKLTKGLFELARFDSDRYFVETIKSDVCEILRRKVISYVYEFEEKNIEYSLDIPESRVDAIINEHQIERVIDNIIQNSLKYNQQDFSISISLKELDNTIFITIEDDGIGIPDELSTKVFDPMFRVESSRSKSLGGTGLGLSISKKIMEKHGGDIVLDTHHKKGCKFVISVPKITS